MRVVDVKITEHVLDVNMAKDLQQTHNRLKAEHEKFSVEYAGHYTVGRRFYAIWHIKEMCGKGEVHYSEADKQIIKRLLEKMGDDDVVSRQSIEEIGKDNVEAFLKAHPEIRYTKLAGGHRKFDKVQLENIIGE